MVQQLICLTTLLSLGAFVGATMAEDNLALYKSHEFKAADGGVLLYRMMMPADYDPDKEYPLVLFLHGAGERGDDNKAQLAHGMRDFASATNREQHPAIVVAPQCPKNQQWVDVPWSQLSHEMPKKPSKSMQKTLELLASLQKELSVDEDRIYITGLSMGGFGTWDAIQRRPDYFAAAAPICGGGDTAFAKQLAHIPIWAFHGDADGAVKVERSRSMIKAIKDAGGDPQYTEYPGVGHNSWAATYANPKFYAWLFEQQRTKK